MTSWKLLGNIINPETIHSDISKKESEILSRLWTKFQLNTVIDKKNKKFDSFDWWGLKHLSKYIRLYLDKLASTIKKGKSTQNIVSDIWNKEFKEFLKKIWFCYKGKEKLWRDKYFLDEKKVIYEFWIVLWKIESNIFTRLQLILVRENKSDSFYEEINKLIKPLTIEKKIGPLGIARLYLEIYLKVLSRYSLERIQEIENDIEMLYLILFFEKDLQVSNNILRADDMYRYSEKAVEIITYFIDQSNNEIDIVWLLQATKDTEEGNYYEIPKNILYFLFTQIDQKKLNFEDFSWIIKLFSKVKYLNETLKTKREGILETIFKLVQQHIIWKKDIEGLEKYFIEKNDVLASKSESEFDCLILELWIFDIDFISKLRNGEQKIFCKIFVTSSDTWNTLKYPKNVIQKIGKDSFERLCELDPDIIDLTIESATYIETLIDQGNILELYYEVISLLPENHSSKDTLQCMYKAIQSWWYQDISKLIRYIEENRISFLVHFLRQSQKSTSWYIQKLLVLTDDTTGNISQQVVDFIEQFFNLSSSTQAYLYEQIKNNPLWLIEELTFCKNTKQLQLFCDFMMKHFRSDDLSVENIWTYYELVLSDEIEQKGQIKELPEEEMESQSIILEMYGPNFSDQIFTNLDEKLFPSLIDIGSFATGNMLQWLIYHLIENKSNQSIEYLEKVHSILWLLRYVWCRQIQKPEKLFLFCKEIVLSEINTIQNYIEGQKYEEIKTTSEKYIWIIMKFLKNKTLPHRVEEWEWSENNREVEKWNTGKQKIASLKPNRLQKKLESLWMYKKRSKWWHQIYTWIYNWKEIFVVIPMGKWDVKYYLIIQTIEKLWMSIEEWNKL